MSEMPKDTSKKNKTFIIHYTITGGGMAEIEAKTLKEALEKWEKGDVIDRTDDYDADRITTIQNGEGETVWDDTTGEGDPFLEVQSEEETTDDDDK